MKLHYDVDQKHFVLLKTLVGYSQNLSCPDCKKVYQYNKASNFHQHELKHIPKEKELTFIHKEIKPTLTYCEQIFGIPLIRDLYFGFDFEAFLEPIDTVFNEFETQAKHINIHRPI